jgi:hypothetical protein
MREIVVLKDNVRSDPFSKINNFTYEWIKWSHFVKVAPLDYVFDNDDIIIINFNDSNDPYKNYSINPKCKKIGIVHQLNQVNFSKLNECIFIIYMNPIMQKIALSQGITKPHHICDRYPEYDFNNVSLNKIQQTFIGGWVDDTNMDSIISHIIKADELTPKSNSFHIGYCTGQSDTKKKLIIDAVNKAGAEKLVKSRFIYVNDKTLSLPMLLFHMRTSSHIYLQSGYPKTELIMDLITSNSNDILNHKIAESSMLSMAKSAKSVISGDIDRINYNTLNNNIPFTYHMFSNIISDILKKY